MTNEKKSALEQLRAIRLVPYGYTSAAAQYAVVQTNAILELAEKVEQLEARPKLNDDKITALVGALNAKFRDDKYQALAEKVEQLEASVNVCLSHLPKDTKFPYIIYDALNDSRIIELPDDAMNELSEEIGGSPHQNTLTFGSVTFIRQKKESK